MTDDTSRVPKLRFPGFAGAWEQRKLRDYLVPSKEKNSALSYGKDEVLSVSGDAGVVNQIQFQGRSYAGASTKDYGVVQTGDVIYTKSPLKKNPFGIIKTNKGKAGIVSTLYAVYKPKDNTYTPFVEVYFDDDARLNNYLRPLVNKGAKNDMKVSKSGALTGLICFPGATEQRMLSEFFQQLEDLITLHQRKLSHLRQLKKGLLQKMFPKSGEDRPEVRFPGFVDAWEQRKLGDLLKEFNIKSKIEDEHKVLSSTNSGMEFREGRVSGTSNLGYKIIKNGDLVLSPQNLWLGNININNIGKGLVSPSYKTFELINIDSSFINPQLRTQKMLEEYKNSSTQGASVVRRNLEIDSFYQIKIFVPTISEQEKIGSFFQQLDNTIVLHQRKLSHLQQQKKALLQQMFV
ncbi:restriction endonuclease subunit S [Bifidobacterium mongoliense]|uniref:restriction endonuclease subunit S n=1 Tax=Bifidobacterium mongoliense TaxID=518643 RepID=UPI0030EB8396